MTKRSVKYFMYTLFTLILPVVTFAANNSGSDYEPLTQGGIPLVNVESMSITGVVNALFALSVGIAAILAVIMLAIGGFRYMTSESVFNMGNAREQISNAIIGLLIVLVSVLILFTINPEIVKLNLFN